MKYISLALIAWLLSACSYFQSKELDSSKQATVQKPKITVETDGVDKELAENIVSHVSLTRKNCDIPLAYLKALTKSAHKEVSEALAAFGYYSPTFTVNHRAPEACPIVKVSVSDLGPATTLTDVDIVISGEAADDKKFMAVVNSLKLRAGDPLNHATYTKAKDTLSALAGERGYFDAKITKSRLEVNPDKAQARVALALDSGVRYKIGDISITQQPDLISESLIRRYLMQSENQGYTADTINSFSNALVQSNYFASVDARPDLVGRQENVIPISLDLTPRAKHSFSASTGISTNEGIRSRLTYLNRRLNRAGHRGVLDGRASFIAQSASMEYLIPRENPRAEWLTFQAGIRKENVDSFDTVETTSSVSETKLRTYGWLETRYIRLSNQEFGIASQNESSLFLIPGLRWTRTTTDDELYPSKGAKYTFEIRGAAEQLLSDTSFVRATLAAHWIRALPFRSRLHLRAAFGGTWVDDFFELPPSERFFTGGDTTIRGYEFEELGPEDDAGEVIGGTYLGVASFEYEHPITNSWSGAAFVDAGNAFGGEGSSVGVKLGIGVGVRWRSPVGPIRADLAHPVDGNQSIRFHLRIGPDL